MKESELRKLYLSVVNLYGFVYSKIFLKFLIIMKFLIKGNKY